MTAPTLVEFLRARLDEREAIARAAIDDDGGEVGGFEDAFDRLTGSGGPLSHVPRFGDAAAALIVDTAVPRRVLADVAAKRAIVDKLDDDPWCLDGGYVYIDLVLRTLATIYADHPDYRQEWKP